MNDSRTVLFELGTEELPPASLNSFWSELRKAAGVKFKQAGLEWTSESSDERYLFTSRRLALIFPDVSPETKADAEIRRGPAFKAAFNEQGEPTKALMGFAGSCGVGKEQIERWRKGEDCERTGKGMWVQFARVVPPRPTQEVLPEIFRQSVAEVSLDVRMRWGLGEEEFARPVRWVVLLYGNEIVPGNLMGLEFGRESRGHRFLVPDVTDIDSAESHRRASPDRSNVPNTIDIDNAKSYRDQLRNSYVLINQGEHAEFLAEQLASIKEHLRKRYDDFGEVQESILFQGQNEAVAAEYPQAILGNFPKDFLSLPKEVVVDVLENQQRFFSVLRRDKELLPHFIAIANLPDKTGRIRTGYERVVQARLQDAEFYLRQDRRRHMEDYVSDLGRVVFHRKLGTLADRYRRIVPLAEMVAREIGADTVAASRAALLCKADLGTDMVQSFPDLQGVMGAHYARLDGEDEAVCQAIEDQYWFPKGNIQLPESRVSRALILADRLDMLIGVFAIGEIPTGTRDPLGVRRAVNTVLFLIMKGEYIHLDLQKLLARAADGYPDIENSREAVPVVMDYFADRLRGSMDDAEDAADAVLALPWRNPADVRKRLLAVHDFRATGAGVALAEANKRIRNILRKSETPDGELDPELLREPAEQALAERVAALRPEVEELCQERQYEQAMEQLSTLAEPVAQFFDDVLVMAEEPELRHNRLRLLRDVRALFLTIADLSRLQGAPKAA